MTLNRATAKTFFKSLDKYESIRELVQRAVDPTNPSLVKSHGKNRAKLDDSYLELMHDWKVFKRDLNVASDVLNEKDENGASKFEHDDVWMEDFKDKYCELIEKSDVLLEADETLQDATDAKEVKDKLDTEISAKQLREVKVVQELGDQMAALSTAITNSVKRISEEVVKMVDGQEGSLRVQAFKADLASVKNEIDDKFLCIYNQFVCMLGDLEAAKKKALKDDFVTLEKAKIDNLVVLLNKKVKETFVSSTVSHHKDNKHDQTYLKKIEPPDFNGDIVDYADFVRKWKAQVGKAGLSAESKMDRLRDHVPNQAAKALYGETSMAGAWNVLDKLFGNKDLIANKLKVQLKSIKPKGKKDQDVLIDLVTEVNNIVLRLKTLNMEQMLVVDSDFLSAVYRVLPSASQKDWLEFNAEIYTIQWEAFMKL